jgi:hypothetical protein
VWLWPLAMTASGLRAKLPGRVKALFPPVAFDAIETRLPSSRLAGA